jgi:hypothetical protein
VETGGVRGSLQHCTVSEVREYSYGEERERVTPLYYFYINTDIGLQKNN